MTLCLTFADFEQAKKISSYFVDFEQVKNSLLTLNKLKKLTMKHPWEKLDAYASVFWPGPHVTGTPPWLLRPVKVSTSSELYPDTWLF